MQHRIISSFALYSFVKKQVPSGVDSDKELGFADFEPLHPHDLQQPLKLIAGQSRGSERIFLSSDVLSPEYNSFLFLINSLCHLLLHRIRHSGCVLCYDHFSTDITSL